MPYMTGRPTSRERLERLLLNAKMAQERRDREINLWQDTYNYYRSDPPTNWDEGGMQLQVNFPFAWYESIIPSLVHENPVFHAEALSEESEEQAPTVEAAITAELRNVKFKKTLKRATYDGLHYGVGIWQLGFYDQGLVPVSAGGEQAETPVAIDEPGPKSNSDLPLGVKPGQIYALPIRPYNFLIDPNATGLDDALWCGVEYVRNLEAVKADKQYKGTDNLSANEYDMPRGMTIDTYKEKFEKDPEQTMVRLIQIWDIVDRKVYIVAPGHTGFLGVFDMKLPVQRFPFYVIHMTDDNETFWNQSPMVPWLNLVEEYNLTISQRLDHLSRFKRKYAYDSSKIDEESMEALRNPMDGTIVPVKGDGQPIRGAIEPIPDANVSTDSYAFTSEAMQRWTQISGTSEFDLGGSRPGERPAAEINRISGASNGRRSALGGRIQSPLEEFADDVRSVMERYYSKERVVKITGDRGDLQWVKYDGSKLAGPYLWKCNIEEMAASTGETRMQKAAQALQVLTPYSQVGSPVPIIDIVPVLTDLAKELGVKDLRVFPQAEPPMDPGHEWFQMLRKGVVLAPNQVDDHAWHIHVHERQLEEVDTLRSPSTLERLNNHIEAHRAMALAQQQSAEGQEAVQKERQGGGSPGPAPGNSNNPGGGAGIFATGGGNTPQDQISSGGATGANIQEVLRGGFQ